MFKQEWSYPIKFPKTTLSVYLRIITKSNRIKSVKLPGIKERYFVMPEWLDKEGNIKEGFNQMFNLFL